MKPYQIKHLMHKIEEIYNVKKKTLDIKMKVPGKDLSEKEQVALIRQGKVKLKSDRNIQYEGYGQRLPRYFDFSKYYWDPHFKPGYDKALQKLQKNRDRVQDQVILGGCDKALEILEAWEKSSRTS